jgi:hypothetical protein
VKQGRHKRINIVQFQLRELPGIVKLTEKESKMVGKKENEMVGAQSWCRGGV